jgi:hypothetical protein
LDQSQSNVLLVLMRLDVNDPNPLHARGGRQEQDIELLDMDREKTYHLLAAVLDPAHRTTSAPATGIELVGSKRETYNRVLTEFHEISTRFYRKGGFIDAPESYTEKQQGEVLDAMASVGCLIHDLFPTKNPVREWLDKILESSGDRAKLAQPVTIITNDFNVPWFWLKGERVGPFLCEVCSLGLLQLSSAGRSVDTHAAKHDGKHKEYEALLIKGSTNLPFLEEELDTITALLEDSDRRAVRSFKAQRASTFDDITRLLRYGEERLRNNFRIVHFSGHYSGKDLLVQGEPAPSVALNPVLDGSVLVLDGCSSGRGLKAWTDVEGLTSRLINDGHALGCVVTVLPVKHDPIASKILWETFYRDLRSRTSTVGQALVRARGALRDHFTAIGSRNPMWAAYQLIGSPALQLCDDDDESDR